MNQGTLSLVLSCAVAAGACFQSELSYSTSWTHEVSSSHTHYQQLSNAASLNSQAVIEFIEKDSPYAKKLRKQLLKQLAKEKNWPAFLKYYQASDDAAVECGYLTALYYSGKTEIALAAVPRLWQVAHSQPTACHDIFEKWRQAGFQTQTVVWQRVELAIAAKNFQLATHLKQFLPEDDHERVDLWIKTTRKPNLITQTTFKRSPIASKIIRDGLIQIADKNPGRAIYWWQHFQKSQTFEKADADSVIRHIALQLALKHDKRSEHWYQLANLKADDVTAHEWHIRAALAHKRWASVKKIIEAAPAAIRTKPCWQYWLARAYYAMGEKQKAKDIMHSIADKRHYYGFLASEHLRKKSKLGHATGTMNTVQIKKVHQHPSVQAAKKHYLSKDFKKARVAWWHGMRSLNKDDKYIAAKVAATWGWHEQAILTAKYANHQNDLLLRFPIPHRNMILSTATQFKLRPEFIYAIIRQESSFQHDAHSPDGARGVMQLLPSTANDYAKSFRPVKNPDLLFNIKHNIHIGGQHVKQMLKTFRGNYVYVAASYNAGMRKVRHWMRRKTVRDTTIWIETLPWVETRNYIKNVLTYTVIYQHHLGEKPDIGQFIGPSKIQRYD